MQNEFRYNFIFRESYLDHVSCTLSLESHETISSMIDKYLKKTGRSKDDVIFTYNAIKLDPNSNLKLNQIFGWMSMITIMVITTYNIIPSNFPCENKKK